MEKTLLTDKPAGFEYPSMEGKGFEPIELRREALYGDNMPGLDRMLIREAPNFLRQQFKEAFERDTFPQTVAHYVGQLEKANFIDPAVLEQLRGLAKEASVTKRKEIKGVYEKVVEVLGELRMERRK